MTGNDDEMKGPNTTRVDPRVRHFGPYGFMTDRAHTDESAIAFVADLVAGIQAPPRAPEAVRAHVDALCDLHRHGAFAYAFFAMAVTESQLGLELALGHLFVEHYPDGIPMRAPATGQTEQVQVASFEGVRRRLRGGYALIGFPQFNGMLASLLAWGHRSGAIARWLERLWARHGHSAGYFEVTRGEKSRVPRAWSDMSRAERAAWLRTDFRRIWEKDMLDNERELRNALAHRTGPFITSPIESARAIAAFADLVDAIWGDAHAAEPTVSER